MVYGEQLDPFAELKRTHEEYRVYDAHYESLGGVSSNRSWASCLSPGSTSILSSGANLSSVTGSGEMSRCSRSWVSGLGNPK